MTFFHSIYYHLMHYEIYFSVAFLLSLECELHEDWNFDGVAHCCAHSLAQGKYLLNKYLLNECGE